MVNISIKSLLKSGSVSWTTWVPWLIFIIVLWAAVNTSFKKDYKTGVIEADAKGYYAYLPAVFIYHDLNFGFYKQIEQETYYNPNLSYDYLRVHNNKAINKYYAGTAVLLLPFFLAGHADNSFYRLASRWLQLLLYLISAYRSTFLPDAGFNRVT